MQGVTGDLYTYKMSGSWSTRSTNNMCNTKTNQYYAKNVGKKILDNPHERGRKACAMLPMKNHWDHNAKTDFTSFYGLGKDSLKGSKNVEEFKPIKKVTVFTSSFARNWGKMICGLEFEYFDDHQQIKPFRHTHSDTSRYWHCKDKHSYTFTRGEALESFEIQDTGNSDARVARWGYLKFTTTNGKTFETEK